MCNENVEKYSDALAKITNSLTQASGIITDNIDYQKNEGVEALGTQLVEVLNTYVDNTERIFNQIERLLESISLKFSNIEEEVKVVCEKMLENGFYPYQSINVSICNIFNVNEKMEIESIIAKQIEKTIKNKKQQILKVLDKYRERVKEIYYLYNKRKYRLCVLAQINLISIIFNEHFGQMDFTERTIIDKIKEVVSEEKVENNYIQFIPYIIDKDRSNDNRKNILLVNYREKRQKYYDVPYSRNAILHGYSKDFGKKIHCLRWFSVLLNTVDLLKICGFTDELGVKE